MTWKNKDLVAPEAGMEDNNKGGITDPSDPRGETRTPATGHFGNFPSRTQTFSVNHIQVSWIGTT